MNKPIFVLGLPRSGSTVWENIIGASPEVLRFAEMLYLTPWRKDFRYFLKKYVGDLSEEKNIMKMINLIFQKETIKGLTGSFWRFGRIDVVNNPKLKENIYERCVNSERDLKNIFKIIIEEITYLSGYKRCCVAFPVYFSYLSKLLDWYPECKIILVTRDPRAIAMSKTNDPSGTALLNKKYPYLKFVIRKIVIFYVIIQYIWSAKIHEKFKNVSNYKLFRYEDLVVEPEKEIRELSQFIEIEYLTDLLNPEEAMESSISGKKYRGISKAPAIHWMSIITKFEKWFINLCTYRSMKKLDFNPSKHKIYKN